ncbi:uncharacterized protein LOC107417154 [Ziziphus jujuba]|uniref:PHD finger protein 23-like n=1 Tax=Ziziphus jujuba TaxID=326968 RepID=A0A6P6G550_ZIZJJ|nr:uncharacterized protein LOC107417154 [Ziziphus jujuba]XP_024928840.1 uncharacterized protein LOC107417154 [Ziziphus jujuba]
MDGGDQRRRRWSNIKQRLKLKSMGCCGPMWSTAIPPPPPPPPPSTLQEEQEEEEDHQLIIQTETAPVLINVGPTSSAPLPVPGMNLATALAAERNSRVGKACGPTSSGAGRVKSLMRLIEETDGPRLNKRRKRDEGRDDTDWMCCVCMERSKGAAFIPCGHTFCRVCSRELWVNRGSCPICIRSIIEILDIY